MPTLTSLPTSTAAVTPGPVEVPAKVITATPQQTVEIITVAFRYKGTNIWNLAPVQASRDAALDAIKSAANVAEYSIISITLPL